MSLLDGRRALVTGGASGIGAAVVARFAAAGATGVVLDRGGQRLARAASPAGRGPTGEGTAHALSPTGEGLPAGWRAAGVDVRDEEALSPAMAAAGRLDIVVAAAGIVPAWSRTAELDLEEWDRVMAVNARGVAATLKHAAPLLRDGGAVVVVASLNAWRGDPNLASYVASKHAALGLVRAAALDLGRRGIRVNAVAPGPIATEALLHRLRTRAAEGGLAPEEALAAAAEQTALGKIATAEDVASATLFLASDLAAGVTGHLLPVDGGIV